MRKILITNDDGINSDGILRLVQTALEFGEVWVVAPDSQRSSMSHSATLTRDFSVWKSEFPVSGVHAFATSGTPSDCVRIGVLGIMPEKPDGSGRYICHVIGERKYTADEGTDLRALFDNYVSIGQVTNIS
ncbi:MAG TPA: hypothetical protein DCQ87_00635 [Lachnospiraceae bacterium]|nr:hypothetical protein [Lachnospiraceae bacterium]